MQLRAHNIIVTRQDRPFVERTLGRLLQQIAGIMNSQEWAKHLKDSVKLRLPSPRAELLGCKQELARETQERQRLACELENDGGAVRKLAAAGCGLRSFRCPRHGNAVARPPPAAAAAAAAAVAAAAAAAATAAAVAACSAHARAKSRDTNLLPMPEMRRRTAVAPPHSQAWAGDLSLLILHGHGPGACSGNGGGSGSGNGGGSGSSIQVSSSCCHISMESIEFMSIPYMAS